MEILSFFFKRTLQLMILVVMYVLIASQLRLYYAPTYQNGINQNVLAQLQYLEQTIKTQNAPAAMQQIFPEGAFFMHVLYGLTWADLVENTDSTSKTARKAAFEVQTAIESLDTGVCLSSFNGKMELVNGAFYNGWQGYLMGRYCAVFPQQAQKNGLLTRFETRCKAIQTVFDSANRTYLESYPQQSWPADNILCLATLALHDKILPNQFAKTRANWLNSIKAHLDERGLIPHSYNFLSNTIGEPARGCSQSMMLSFLPVIDSVFSRQQFDLYKKNFIDKRLGIACVREYPHGASGNGDVDSGPVIWDVGGAASIVGIKAAVLNGDNFLYHNFRNAIEMLGFPRTTGNFKYYLFEKLPVSDAFIAWVNATHPHFKVSNGWQRQVHGWSLLVLAYPLWYFGRKIYKWCGRIIVNYV
jgi:hypothetical protein